MANMAQAIRLALHYGEKNLGLTNIFGEDVGPPLGGVFTVTQGLDKTWNSPLDERGIIGASMGLASDVLSKAEARGYVERVIKGPESYSRLIRKEDMFKDWLNAYSFEQNDHAYYI